MRNKDKMVRFEVRITADLAKQMDVWRVKYAPLEPRTVAVRRLIEAGLKSFEGQETKE